MNVELALRALELAKANPERFDMNTFSSGWFDQDAITKDGQDFVPPCGTTACYAGWVSYVAAPAGSRVQGSMVHEPGKRFAQHVEGYAIKALDITADQANTLFYLGSIGEVEAAVTHLAGNPDADGDELHKAARGLSA